MAASRTADRIGELIWVPIDKLKENPWNPNVMDDFMFRKELASIEKFGMVDPVTVREAPPFGWEIIDGEHRWKACVKLGHHELPVWNVGTISDPVAKQLTIVLNETRGSHERQAVSELLRDLLTSEPTQDLLGVLPYTEEAFAAMVDLPPFDWGELDHPTDHPTNGAGEHWVERIFRMPTDAAEILDLALKKVRDGDGEMPDWKALELICADFNSGA